jgi:hypothetical protein
MTKCLESKDLNYSRIRFFFFIFIMKYFEITDKRDKEIIYRLINGENLRFTQFFIIEKLLSN